MELFGFLRQLWGRRWLVCLGVVLALAAAILVVYRIDPGGSPVLESHDYEIGVASASVLVDSQSSQVVDLGSGEEEGESPDLATLAERARLLSTLMVSSPLKEQIAARAGVPAQSLIARVSSTEPVVAPTPIATGTMVSPSDREAHILSLQTAESIPIITIDVQAPSEAGAVRLASSAVAEILRYMKSVAVSNRVPNARQLVVAPLGHATSATVVKGARRWVALGVFCMVVATWCAGIVMIPALARNWRETALDEAAEAGPASGGHQPEDHEGEQDTVDEARVAEARVEAASR